MKRIADAPATFICIFFIDARDVGTANRKFDDAPKHLHKVETTILRYVRV